MAPWGAAVRGAGCRTHRRARPLLPRGGYGTRPALLLPAAQGAASEEGSGGGGEVERRGTGRAGAGEQDPPSCAPFGAVTPASSWSSRCAASTTDSPASTFPPNPLKYPAPKPRSFFPSSTRRPPRSRTTTSVSSFTGTGAPAAIPRPDRTPRRAVRPPPSLYPSDFLAPSPDINLRNHLKQ